MPTTHDTHNYSRLSNAELRRLEGDRDTSSSVWREVVAELARRDRPSAAAPIDSYAPSASLPAGRGSAVLLTGLDIPFWDLVWVLVKTSIAAIPAMIILVLCSSAAIAVLAGIATFVRLRFR